MGLIDVVRRAQSLSPLDAQSAGLSGLQPTWLVSEEASSAGADNGELVSWRGVPTVSELVKQKEKQEELLIAELKARSDDSLSLAFLDGLLRSYFEQVLSPNPSANPNPNPEPNASLHSSPSKKRVPHTDFAKLLKQASPLLGQKLLSLTLRTCVASQSFDEVRAMLESRALSGNTHPDLVATLIEHDQAALLCMWVQNVCDPRFPDLLLVLKYFLKSSLRAGKSLAGVRLQWQTLALIAIQRLSDMKKTIESNEEGKESGIRWEKAKFRALLLSAAVDHFQPYELSLHYFVSSGHDEAVLTSILSQLENNEVLTLLQYLKKWLEKYSRRGSLCALHFKREDLWVPSLGDILQWTSILLDAHMMSLVLCSDFHTEILSVQRLIKGLTDAGRILAPLAGITEHLRTKAVIPTQPSLYGEDDHVIEYLEI